MFPALIIIFIFINTSLLAQQQFIFRSAYLNKDDTVWVFEPETNIRATLYMLHGWNGDYKQWSEICNLQNYADSLGLLIVCPDGLKDSWYFNSVKEEDPVYFADFLIDDLIAYIDSYYDSYKSPRFITGLSMGGYGSFYIYLKYPRYFMAAFSTSGAFDLTQPVMQKYGIEKRLGARNKNRKHYKYLSILSLMKNKKLNKQHYFYFDCGGKDPFLKSNQQVNDYLEKTPARQNFYILPGEHTSEYWQKSIRRHFKLIDRIVK